MPCFLTIRRGPNADAGRFGQAALTTDDGPGSYDCLELPWRDNRPGKSCICVATYQARPVHSPHFGFTVYQLLSVPGRTAVEIHPANWAGDVDLGYHSDLLGCIAIGHGTGELVPPGKTAPQRALLNSRKAFEEFMALTKGAPLTVRIVDFGAVGPNAL